MKRTVATLLALIMCIGIFGITPCATGEGSIQSTWYNVTWTLDSAGTLTISGDGVVNFLTGELEGLAWMPYADDIKKLVIEEGITEIRAGAFMNCVNLTEVILPEGLLYIHDSVFSGCTSLTKINLPEGLKSVGENAFLNCNALAEVDLPLWAPDGIDDALEDLSLVTDPDNWEDGVLYIGNVLYKADLNISGSYTVKDGALSIYANAFEDCGQLTKLVLPEGLVAINAFAFYDCYGLEPLSLPESLKAVGNYALEPFATNEVVLPGGLEYIGHNLFGATADEDIINGCVYNGKYLLRRNSNVETITVKEGTELIAARAFSNSGFGAALVIAQIILPESLKIICPKAFAENKSLKTAVLPANLETVMAGAFENCENLESIGTLPESLENVSESAFKGCKKLESIGSIANLTEIREYAFYDCAKAFGEELVVPGAVGEIGDSAFYGCSSIKRLELQSGIAKINHHAFYGLSELTDLVIPDTVTYIGDYAFQECTSLDDVSFDGVAEYIGYSIFSGTAFAEDYTNRDEYGVLYLGKNLISAGEYIDENGEWARFKAEEYTVKEGTVTIATDAFGRNSTVKMLILPDSLTIINDWSIFSAIKELHVGSGVEYLGAYCFGSDTLSTVYYNGTASRWKSVTIGSNNAGLENATIVYLIEDSLGDVNGDGDINSLDAAQVLKHDALLTNLDNGALTFADTNGDGAVNSLDATQILKLDAGLISGF